MSYILFDTLLFYQLVFWLLCPCYMFLFTNHIIQYNEKLKLDY